MRDIDGEGAACFIAVLRSRRIYRIILLHLIYVYTKIFTKPKTFGGIGEPGHRVVSATCRAKQGFGESRALRLCR